MLVEEMVSVDSIFLLTLTWATGAEKVTLMKAIYAISYKVWLLTATNSVSKFPVPPKSFRYNSLRLLVNNAFVTSS
jgi:hypothetical protein